MKKLTLLLSVIFLTTIVSQAQDSNFYLGIGVGYATAGGDREIEDVKGGISLKFIDMGYRFDETWGITAGLISSGHTVEDYDADELTIGVGSLAIGPMYTTKLGSASWDIKPQIAINYKVITDGDLSDDDEYSGSAFIIGNSFIFGDTGKGWVWSIDVDYRMGKMKEIEGEDLAYEIKLNNLIIGAGLRYNF